MRSQYIIITIIFTALFGAMLALAYAENEQRRLGNDFWSVYFLHPLENKNDFVIDNTDKDSLFIYKIMSNEKELQRGEITVKKDEQKIIEIENDANIIPITIEITDGFNEKILEKK